MGDLPRILARTDVPNAPAFPRVPAGAMGAPWATLAEVGKALKETQAPIDAAKQTGEWDVRVTDLKNTIQAGGDPNTWRSDFLTQAPSITTELGANITDSRTKKAFDLHVAKMMAHHTIDLTGEEKKAVHAKQRGDIEVEGNKSVQLVANTTDPILRDAYIKRHHALIAGAAQPAQVAGRMLPGALTPKEAEQEHEKFDKEVDKQTAYAMVGRDPPGLIKALEDPKNFPVLTGPERTALRNHAEAVVNDRKRLAKEVKQEEIDIRNTDLLEKNVNGRLTVSDVMAIPDKDLPFANKRFWVDRINEQLKAKEHKEIDPFEKSDGATRAIVMNGILSKPADWPQERILAFMGRGLSTTHSLQLVNMQKELTKEKSDAKIKKYDPLHAALDTLDGLRRSYMFTKEGQDEKVTDATAAGPLRLKNDEEYNKIANRVIEAAHAGQDPRAVLQQEMKPYFEQKTKGWFERWANWFTVPLQAPPAPAGAATGGVAPGPSLAPPGVGGVPPLPEGAPPEMKRRREELDRQTREAVPQIQGTKQKTVEGLNRLDEAAARYRKALEASPDEEARNFLLQNGKLITSDTLERTKKYLKSKKAGGK